MKFVSMASDGGRARARVWPIAFAVALAAVLAAPAPQAAAADPYPNCQVWIHYEFSVGATCNSDAPGTEYQAVGRCRHVPTGREAIVHGPWKLQWPASRGFNTSYANCPDGTRAVEAWRNVR